MQSSLIICTAGHVDHGKTSLLKALTGFDCDTHPEEKKRGITINLGFTYIRLESGDYIAFVDVPGHRDFINIMVAGASGVDHCMLIVAADDSVMPQTIEHLRILELLGIESGFIVITKTDLVNDELLLMCESEIMETVKGTFLENQPIFKISSRTHNGINDLKAHLSKLPHRRMNIHQQETFRMYVDRCFVSKGFGTIVTGSILGGEVKKTDRVYLHPLDKFSRIRQIQRHGMQVAELHKGERGALNLIDINHNELGAGDLILKDCIKPTAICDVQLSLIDDPTIKPLKSGAFAILLLGGAKSIVRIHLLGADNLKKSEVAYAQLSCERNLIPFRGDRFIIRSTSSDITLGGGIILDPYPLKHVRKTKKLLDHLHLLASGENSQYILVKVEQSPAPIGVKELSGFLQCAKEDVMELAGKVLKDSICMARSEHDEYLLSSKHKDLFKKELSSLLERCFIDNADIPVSVETLLEYARKRNALYSEELTKETIQDLVSDNKLAWAKTGYKLNFPQQTNQLEDKILGFINKNRNTAYTADDLLFNLKTPKTQIANALKAMVFRKELHYTDGQYLAQRFIDDCRKALLRYLNENKQGITVSEFRKIVESNRKISILLFSIFEAENIIERSNDVRIITPHGLNCKY
jgi:selenocysteine-specific elongation factor